MNRRITLLAVFLCTMVAQGGTKKAVRRNEKIPEARFFAVFFNQSHVLQEKFRRGWYFFSQNGADV